MQIKDSLLHYRSRLGQQPPVNVSLSDTSVSDGEWHNVSLIQTNDAVRLVLDNVENEKPLDSISVHEFLDPYLTSVFVGGTDAVDSIGKNLVMPSKEFVINIFFSIVQSSHL